MIMRIVVPIWALMAVVLSLSLARASDISVSGWHEIAPMTQARSGHAAILKAPELADLEVNPAAPQEVLVVGGYGPSSILKSTEVYNPDSRAWKAFPDMNTARYGHTITRLLSDATETINDLVVIGGASCYSGCRLASVDYYNVTVPESWQTRPDMGTPRYLHTATYLPARNQILVVGGSDNTQYLRSAEFFIPTDASNAEWGSAESMLTPRHGHTATLLSDGRVLVTGGFNATGYLASIEIYDPVTDTWQNSNSSTPPADMGSARAYHTATLLPGDTNQVLVAGGLSGAGPLAGAELYNISNNTWTAVADMAEPRYLHTATLSGGNRLLVAGGSNYATGYLASAEIFTDTWNNASDMPTPRRGHTAILLANGSQILVAGGTNDNSIAITSASIFTPELSAPLAITGQATGITRTSASLNGVVNDNGAVTGVSPQAPIRFEYFRSDIAGDPVVAVEGNPAQILVPTFGDTAVTTTLTSLDCDTNYSFQIKAENTQGSAAGLINTFTTLACDDGPKQKVYSISDTLLPGTAYDDGEVALVAPAGGFMYGSVLYDTNYLGAGVTTDYDRTLTGLGLRMHFDSTKIQEVAISNVFAPALVNPVDDKGVVQIEPLPDTADYDGDAETDTYIAIAWFDPNNPAWPNLKLPLQLFDMRLAFASNVDRNDQSHVRFTFSSTASNADGGSLVDFTFENDTPIVLQVDDACTLDVDGDGAVNALTDGILMVRYEFGFKGQVLSDDADRNAVGANCTRCMADEIEAFLDRCTLINALDIDAEGSTEALTDGLLTARYEFGFAGELLISGAVDEEEPEKDGDGACSRCDAESITTYLNSLDL